MPEDRTHKIRRVYNAQKDRYSKESQYGNSMTTSVRNAARLATAAIVGVPVREVKEAIAATAGTWTTARSGAPRWPDTDADILAMVERTIRRSGAVAAEAHLHSEMVEPAIVRVDVQGDPVTYLVNVFGEFLGYEASRMSPSAALAAFKAGTRTKLPGSLN